MRKAIFTGAALAALVAGAARAQDNYIGEVMLVGFNFCPRGTATADGQLLPIAQNQALFALFGTIYGGDGRTTFALPDLRGRVPIHAGQGPGLSNYPIGSRGGTETQTLGVQQMPGHSHDVSAQLNGSGAAGSSPSPGGNLPAVSTTAPIYGSIPQGGTPLAMSGQAISVAQNTVGGGQPFSNLQPYQTMRYCVALQGIFPPRN